MGRAIHVNCVQCGAAFKKKASEVKRTPMHYCSKKCYGAALQAKALHQFFERCAKKANGCLEWTGSRNKDDYGQMKVGQKVTSAHRIAWSLTNGPIPKGMHVLHRCDNPPCCNPEHLFLGTHADNMADMRRKDRVPTKLTVEAVEAIRRSPESSEALALRYGVSPRTIRYAKQVTHWRPLGPAPEKE